MHMHVQELWQGGDCEADVRVSVAVTGGGGQHQGSRRGGGGGGGRGGGSLWSPRFPRAKEVGWWIVLGTEDGELLALKRVSETWGRLCSRFVIACLVSVRGRGAGEWVHRAGWCVLV